MKRPQRRIPAPLLAGGTLLAGLVSALVLSTSGPTTKSFNLAVAPAEDGVRAAAFTRPDAGATYARA